MIKLENLGYHTDCIARKLEGEFLERDGYILLRMPTNPTFYWGNLLVFRNAPGPGDFEKWISAHLREFGEQAGHVTFGWESQEAGDVDKFIENGFSLDSTSVLVLEELSQVRPAPTGLIFREIVTDADWEAVLKLQFITSETENPGAEYLEFKTRLLESYRRLSENNYGAWWGAFKGDQLVADMGLYFDDTFATGRFQSVETHPDYRRMGICTGLLHTVARHALENHPNVALVICADFDSVAERIYLNLGFKRHQMQYGVCLEQPLDYKKVYGNGWSGPGSS